MAKRVFLIVLDSVGIGEMPDAARFHSEGANTMRSCTKSPFFDMPNMTAMGLFNIDGMDYREGVPSPTSSFARMAEKSEGKDTTIGHWEIAGLVSPRPMPTYPEGFPKEVIDEFSSLTGRGVLCNKPYSGTPVIED